MQFQRLRLSGFKSFVEPTELRIEPGLTGVLGPNGCGKSNLLEALRWVMGANSAKAMRGGGMDDVIFSGTSGRPARNHAEVTLTIDNSDRLAPAPFNDAPMLEVVRRIDRGEGSTYRINGREVRARDVQLLFADASTGANSPALVRQGQISELISARPQNRRRILEEAAGVSGLHTRRHEAELRVRAAETNLARLGDVMRELEGTLGRLRREARQAAAFKRLSAEIRALQNAVHYARWVEARDALTRLDAEAGQAAAAVEQAARAVARAQTDALEAEAAIRPLREEDTIAAAVLHRLMLEKDRLDHQAETAAAEMARWQGEIVRIDGDAAREAQIIEDSARALARLEAELLDIRTEIASAPERLPGLEAVAAEAEAARAAAQEAVMALGAKIAAAEAQGQAHDRRMEEARIRLARAGRALEQARADRAALGAGQDPHLAPARVKLSLAETRLSELRAAVDAAEAAQVAAAAAEVSARNSLRAAEDDLRRLTSEAEGLRRLTATPTGKAYPAVLDAVAPEAGYEAALAAALGDDLNAALDPAAPAYWGGADAPAPEWPVGARALAPLIRAPLALAARLAFTALVDRADGPRLQAGLKPGQRLVSREGDLWRWDGFVARADAPRPAAVRLAQKSRLAAAEAEIERLRPALQVHAAAHKAATTDLAQAVEVLRLARAAPREAEKAVAEARFAAEALERDSARREARAQALDDTIARFEVEHAEAAAGLAAVTAEPPPPVIGALADELAALRRTAAETQEAAAAARTAVDVETRERTGRERRLEALQRDHADWAGRSAAAARRQTALTADRLKAVAALKTAREAPDTVQADLTRLLDELGSAESRKARASDALQQGETRRAEADRTLRAAEALAAEARETRAALSGHLDGARERFSELASALRQAAHMEPEALGRKLAEEAVAIPADAGGVEAHLANLQRQRDQIGPVNLRAEEEAAEHTARLATMKSEQVDLTGALSRLRQGIDELNSEGRERLLAAFDVINGHFRTLFTTLFNGGEAELRLVESDDPLEAGLEIFACPPGKRLSTMSLMSGGEQALTATALIFGVFLANPAPICVLDEVDAPLDDANVERFCNLLAEMRSRAPTRFITITHNPLTMSRMDRLFGVTMPERGVSQLVSVDLLQAESLAAQ